MASSNTSSAWEAVSPSSSTMFFPLQVQASASSLYRAPPQASHSVTMGSMKASSVTMTPLPPHAGQAPAELKLNRLSGLPLSRARSFRISSKKPR